MLHGAGSGEHHAWRAIMRMKIGAEMRGAKRLHAFRRAEDRPSQGLVGKSELLGEVEDHVLRRIEGGSDLLQDHVALARQLHVVECRCKNNVAEKVERKLEISA